MFAKLIKKRPQRRCLPVKFAKFSRTPILQNISSGGPAKWRVTVSGELWFVTSYL